MEGVSAADQEKQPDDVARMFDDTAKRYDTMNTLMTFGQAQLWRLQMTRAVRVKPGERILDVAAGTGSSAAPMAKAGALVTCVDLSEGMIAEGRKRNPDLEFIHASAEELPFDDNSFDAVTISYGLRNVQKPKQALAEFFRVLKPGGRVLIAEFSHPPVGVVKRGYETYMKIAIPGMAKLMSSNPDSYDYLLESIQKWPDQGTLSQWLRSSGFTRVAHRNLSMGIVAMHRGFKPRDKHLRMPFVLKDNAED
ncbi:class I SAM-dependent methyltransferase [Agrococcus casei]|uniref:Demethylmenaquinone methyltransferase n=1 Tax=Agrococcus casei LMG 22410 TaxID=1255656 RepID=A0A1R4G9W7_9MICO|nr:class I SAM-dependent methyltransferase [Agrococcus casei]SJM64946.1 2-heptaprenyl-1,4-naphthoquinone methyltransferase [Agrococcus casei LMG 22410]